MDRGEPIDERQPFDPHILESAPIPVSGQTLCNTPFMPLRTLGISLVDGSARRPSQLPTILFFFRLRHLSSLFHPSSILRPAVPTSPLNHSVWMKVCILIKRDSPLRMLAAKYISAVPAMMPPLEQTEMFLAYWRIADCRVGVWFPVLARWWPGYFREICGWNRERLRFVFVEFSESILKSAAGCCGSLACWSILCVV